MNPEVGEIVFHEYWPFDLKVLIIAIEDKLAKVEFLENTNHCAKGGQLWVTYEYLKKFEPLKKHRIGVR